jgi:hypothetical protein
VRRTLAPHRLFGLFHFEPRHRSGRVLRAHQLARAFGVSDGGFARCDAQIEQAQLPVERGCAGGDGERERLPVFGGGARFPIGGVIGILAAFGIGYVFGLFVTTFSMVYTLSSIVVAFACATLIGVTFGYFPARAASRLDPIEALARL